MPAHGHKIIFSDYQLETSLVRIRREVDDPEPSNQRVKKTTRQPFVDLIVRAVESSAMSRGRPSRTSGSFEIACSYSQQTFNMSQRISA